MLWCSSGREPNKDFVSSRPVSQKLLENLRPCKVEHSIIQSTYLTKLGRYSLYIQETHTNS